MFRSFQYTAYRLETLQHYDVPYEQEPFRRFLAGEPCPVDYATREWALNVRAQTAARKRFQRVHVVVEPLTDYLKFELTWPYAAHVEAGEEIRIIPVAEGSWPAGVPGHGRDYWLFDSCLLVRTHYDPAGRFVGAEITDEPGAVVQASLWRDAAWQQAIPYAEYLARLQPQHSAHQAASSDKGGR